MIWAEDLCEEEPISKQSHTVVASLETRNASTGSKIEQVANSAEDEPKNRNSTLTEFAFL